MTARPKTFKVPPKRFHPPGLSILYEDHDILVVDKAPGLLTISTEKVREKTAVFLLNAYVKKGNQKSRNRVFVVHRLDRETSGVLIFAKSEKHKRFLQDEWEHFQKKYYAVVYGSPAKKQDVITTYLAENRAYRMYSVGDPAKGKLAKTGYRVIAESRKYSLLEVDLLTGRKNQIRVHLAEQGFPVVGDKVYGEVEKGPRRLALHASSLVLKHPFTKESMTFDTGLPTYFESFVKI